MVCPPEGFAATEWTRRRQMSTTLVDGEGTMKLRTVVTLAVGFAVGVAVILRDPDDVREDAEECVERVGAAFREHAPHGLAIVVEHATRGALAIATVVIRQAVKAARKTQR